MHARAHDSSENATVEEEDSANTFFWGFRNRWRVRCWLDSLDDEQIATLQEMIEDNRAEVKAQLEAWNVSISDLDDEQRKILKTMIEDNRAEVKEQLEAWGVELPECQGPLGLRGSLADEQLEELQTMRQDFRDSVEAKLKEWGVEPPEFHGGMGFRRRGFRGFGLFKSWF